LARQAKDLVVVALVERLTPRALRAASAHGASGLLDRASDHSRLVLAVQGAMAGCFVVPSGSLTAVLRERGQERSWGMPAQDLELLSLLANGDTISAAARKLKQSERSAYRQLGRIYHSLGVRGRVEAVSWFARGQIDDAGQDA
jgi:DNA-binding NarL/FixJ family response regulator